MIPALFMLAAGALAPAPIAAGGPIAHPLLAIVLDGAPAVVAVAGEALVAFRLDGKPVPGFPLSLGAGESAAGGPAAADLDGDGRPEIAIVTAAGKVLLAGKGGVPAGFPVKLGAPARAGPSFVDVDGDGRPEVVVGDELGRLHAFGRGGAEAAGWPVSLGNAAVTSTASSARFGGSASLAVGCGDGSVHVLSLPSRKERKGFPLTTGFEVSGAPAFADLDEDGVLDLVVASQDFSVHAVNDRGEPLRGFPVQAEYRIYGGVALADLDGDGHTDVAFASADGAVHAVSAAGKPLAGWPAKPGGRLAAAPVAADLDRDGRAEIIALAADGTLFAFQDGKGIAGFPLRTGAQEALAAPVLVETAGGPVLAVGLASGEIQLVLAPSPGRAARASAPVPAPAPWPMAGRDPARSGRFGPNPVRYLDLALDPAAPRAGEALAVSYRVAAADLAPDAPAPLPSIEWRRDGVAVPELRGRREVPAGTTRKGERWTFAVAGAAGAAALAPEVRVGNSRPGTAKVALAPEVPTRASPARLQILQPAVDPDGDRLETVIEWLLDGVPVAGVHGDSFPPDRLVKGALLTVRVTARDADGAGQPATAEALVGNTPPPAVPVRLAPQAPRRGEAITAQVPPPGTDADGDALTLRFRWRIAGEPANVPLSTITLPASAVRKGQRVQVEVRAFDGAQEGPPSSAEVEVLNDPPTAPAAEIQPAQPRKGDPLRAVVTAPATDRDGDPIGYRFEWRRSGERLPAPGDGRELPAANLRKGDVIELFAFASDGQAEGPPGRAQVRIGNTRPGAPRIALDPAVPRGGEPVRVTFAERPADPDGDPVDISVAWSRDGKPIAVVGETLGAEHVRKGPRLRAVVTVRDAEGPGLPAAAEARVANSPPGAPAVAIEPERPVAGVPLRARIVKQAVDRDGDSLSYRYRWRRDGFPLAVPDGRADSRKEPFWTSSAELPGAEVKKKQRFTVEVQAQDADSFGPIARAETKVGNTPPPAPRVAFSPDPPRTAEPLRVVVTQPPDVDGDGLTWRFAWTRNGAPAGLAPTQAELPRGAVKKGERWRVEVFASDGEAESPAGVAEAKGGNSPPGALSISLCDGPVAADAPLAVTVREPAVDPDGDPVVVRYSWFLNGKPLGLAKGMAKLSGQGLSRGDVVRVVAEAFDGIEAGPPAAAECLLANSPPGAPEIAIEPAAPTAETGMKVVVRLPAPDRDRDAVTYRTSWLRDGQPAGVELPAVAPRVGRRGEPWTAVVRAFDGEAQGPPVLASVRIANQRPPRPTVAVRPETPSSGQPLACLAKAPEKDADGDRLELRNRWLRNGEPTVVAEGRAELPGGVVRRGEKWACEAWTFDGEAESERVRSQITVRSSPPGEPKVAIEPEKPRRGDALTCRIVADAEDPDGDRVRYAYAWTRSDAPVSVPAPGMVVPGELVKKGDRWRCAATPNDGELVGPAGRAEARVGNTPPRAPRVAIAPASPGSAEPLRCVVTAPAVDPDGDAVKLHYAFYRNGEEQTFAQTTTEVPARLLRDGDRWRCTATPADAEASGPPGSSLEVTVGAVPRVSRQP